MSDQAYKNTDRELWREGDPEDGMSYYEPSIHVTEQGGIGINVGGTVYVRTLREWHGLVEQYEDVRDKWVTLDAEHDRLKEQLEHARLAPADLRMELAEVKAERDMLNGTANRLLEQVETLERKLALCKQDEYDAVQGEAGLQEQLEAAQAENRMLRMWLCTDGAMARGLAESMTELPIAFSVEGVEENAARIVELLNIEQRLGLPSASTPASDRRDHTVISPARYDVQTDTSDPASGAGTSSAEGMHEANAAGPRESSPASEPDE